MSRSRTACRESSAEPTGASHEGKEEEKVLGAGTAEGNGAENFGSDIEMVVSVCIDLEITR